MNREIKFRVWDGLSMRYSFDGFSSETCVLTDVWVYMKESNYSVMQFTGLKDKNGKEIYEGDICLILYTDWPSNSSDMHLDEYLKSISHKGIIEYHDFSFYIMIKNRYDESSKNSIDYGKHGRIEVIGNIHENSELLK